MLKFFLKNLVLEDICKFAALNCGVHALCKKYEDTDFQLEFRNIVVLEFSASLLEIY